MKEEFIEWLERSNLKRIQAYNIACVVYQSAAVLLSKKFPALHVKKRMHLLTELDCFKLNQQEEFDYNIQKSNNPDYENLEKIAIHFIRRWKSTSQEPSNEEILNFTSKKHVHLQEFIPNQVNQLDVPNSVFHSVLLRDSLRMTNTIIEEILNLPDADLIGVLQENQKDFSLLTRNMSFINSDSPKQARKKFIDNSGDGLLQN